MGSPMGEHLGQRWRNCSRGGRAGLAAALVATALCLLAPPHLLPTAHALGGTHMTYHPSSSSSSSSGGGSPAVPPGEPNLVGSGLRLRFHASPNQAYCLVSDPCLHINALMDGMPGSTWVRGYGIKAGTNSVSIQAIPPFQASKYSDIAVTVNGQRSVLGPSSRRVLLSSDKEIRIERWGTREGVLLVSLHSCGVRLLVFVKKGWTLAYPRLSLDVLDWDNLDSPHGIIGQIFPNRANPSVFSSASSDPLPSNTPTGTVDTHSPGEAAPGYTARLPRSGTRPWYSADARTGKRLTPAAAIRRLYSMIPATQVLDGVPEDYLASGILEADCIFSRFVRGGAQGGSGEDPEGGVRR